MVLCPRSADCIYGVYSGPSLLFSTSVCAVSSVNLSSSLWHYTSLENQVVCGFQPCFSSFKNVLVILDFAFHINISQLIDVQRCTMFWGYDFIESVDQFWKSSYLQDFVFLFMGMG